MLMLGLGATLSVQEVKKTLKKWKPLCVGMLSQFGLMPLVAFCFALALDAPNHLGLGMVLMGSAPGGSTSNLFTYWSKGDLALSISMTVVSTTCALFMMPLLLLIYSSRFSDDDIKPDYVSTVLALAIVLVPVGLGVFFNTKWPKCGKRLALVANIVGVIFIIAAIVVGSVTETHIFDADWRTWLAAIFMLIIAAAFGYFLCFLFRQSPRVRRTVALEVRSMILIKYLHFSVLQCVVIADWYSECNAGDRYRHPNFSGRPTTDPSACFPPVVFTLDCDRWTDPVCSVPLGG